MKVIKVINNNNVCVLDDSGREQIVSGKGIGFGAVLAMVISYVNWNSIGWAILHGIFNWGYVIYYIIKYGWS